MATMAHDQRAHDERIARDLASILDHVVDRLRDEIVSAVLPHLPGSNDDRQVGHGGDLLSVGEAARAVDVRPGTIRDWIKRGRLNAVRAGRRYRIRRADLQRSLQAPEAGAAVSISEAASEIIRSCRNPGGKK